MPVNMPAAEKMSRHDMLKWVNQNVSLDYKKIEDLCSGAAYCQLLDILIPDSIPIKRVRFDAKLEHECLSNWRLLQLGFSKNKIEKNIPIDKLLKGRFQDNFEFLQWFKKFYDSTRKIQTNSDVKLVKNSLNVNQSKISSKIIETISSNVVSNHSSPSNTILTQLEKLSECTGFMKHERDFYLSKLKEIETLCDELNETNQSNSFTKSVERVLWLTKKEFKQAFTSTICEADSNSMSPKESINSTETP